VGAPVDPKVQVLYDHFVGTWAGTDVYVKDDATIKIAVIIVITKTKNQDGLQLEYTYSEKASRATITSYATSPLIQLTLT